MKRPERPTSCPMDLWLRLTDSQRSSLAWHQLMHEYELMHTGAELDPDSPLMKRLKCKGEL